MTFRIDDGQQACAPPESVARARMIAAAKTGQYILGTGGYNPPLAGHQSAQQVADVPWTTRDGVSWGSDCAGFVVWCLKLRRHRPGFNRGPWSSVSDDLNCNSMLEDAQHKQELFELHNGLPQSGDMLVYPSFHLKDDHGNFLCNADGSVREWIGHICLVVDSTRARSWDPAAPRYDLIDVAQCHGPNGFKPGVVLTDGSIWSHHDSIWPKPEHRTWVIRAKNV